MESSSRRLLVATNQFVYQRLHGGGRDKMRTEKKTRSDYILFFGYNENNVIGVRNLRKLCSN